jgi:hypothetical protein
MKNSTEKEKNKLNDSLKKDKDKDKDKSTFSDPINSIIGFIDIIKCLFK